MITHDLSTAAHFADRIAVMYLGRIVEEGPAREVVTEPAASVHEGAHLGRAEARPAHDDRAADPRGRDAEPDRVPPGMPVPPALPDRNSGVSSGRPGAADAGGSGRLAPRSLHPRVTLPADLVLTGGSVFTADTASTVVEAVAVRDGRISWVGPADEAEAQAGPATRVLDLEGRTVLPGFQDAHSTRPRAVSARCGATCTEPSRARRASRRSPATPRSTPSSTGSRAAGGRSTPSRHGTPSRADLDAIVPDRPAFFDNRDGHGAWVNTVALAARRHLARDTPIRRAGGSSASSRASRRGRCTRTRCTSSWSCCLPTTHEEWERGILARTGSAPRARDHGLAGRAGRGGDARRLPLARRARRADHAGGGEPALGPRAR